MNLVSSVNRSGPAIGWVAPSLGIPSGVGQGITTPGALTVIGKGTVPGLLPYDTNTKSGFGHGSPAQFTISMVGAWKDQSDRFMSSPKASSLPWTGNASIWTRRLETKNSELLPQGPLPVEPVCTPWLNHMLKYDPVWREKYAKRSHSGAILTTEAFLQDWVWLGGTTTTLTDKQVSGGLATINIVPAARAMIVDEFCGVRASRDGLGVGYLLKFHEFEDNLTPSAAAGGGAKEYYLQIHGVNYPKGIKPSPLQYNVPGDWCGKFIHVGTVLASYPNQQHHPQNKLQTLYQEMMFPTRAGTGFLEVMAIMGQIEVAIRM